MATKKNESKSVARASKTALNAPERKEKTITGNQTSKDASLSEEDAAPQPSTQLKKKTAEIKDPKSNSAPKKHYREIKPPKTSVKTSIAYRPSYIPLENRTADNMDEQKTPMVRYSDADLAEFREIINKKLESAKGELAYLQGLITRKDAMGGDESESRYVTMEDGGISMEREHLSQMASRQISYIDHLEKALMRIENKTYGICRVTGKLIEKARLKAVPHATLSLEAKMGLIKSGKKNLGE